MCRRRRTRPEYQLLLVAEESIFLMCMKGMTTGKEPSCFRLSEAIGITRPQEK